MKYSFLQLVVVVVTILKITACGGDNHDIELSDEMYEFIGMINGTSENVTEALEKFGASEDVIENDIGMFDLTEPVIKAKQGDCYSIEFTDGIVIRMYDICWTEGKISSIQDKGIK